MYCGKKIGVVLPGGAAHGAGQAGAILSLQEAGIKPDIVIASSSGIYNAAIWGARDGGAMQMCEFWRNLHARHFFPLAWREWLRNGRVDSLFTPKKIEEHLLAVANIYDQREDMEVEISVLNLDTRKVEHISNRSPDFRQAIWAGTAIAPFYPAVYMKDEHGHSHQYIDAGLGRNFMVQRCFEKGCDAVVLVNVVETQKTRVKTQITPGKIRNMIEVLWDTTTMVIHRVFADSEGRDKYDGSRVFKIYLPKGVYWSTLRLNNWWFRVLIKAGYEETARVLATTDFFRKLQPTSLML